MNELTQLIEKLKHERITINRRLGKPLATMSRTIDISIELDILTQAQKIINKYDMHTKENSDD